MSDTDLADRYGTRATWRRPALLAAVVVVVLAAAAVLGWIIKGQADPDVASGQLTFDVVDDRTASARFTVDKDDDVEATWAVRADGELAGMIGLHGLAGGAPQIGYWMTRDHRGRGWALRGVTALVSRLRELGASGVTVCTPLDYVGAVATYRAAGLHPVEHLTSIVRSTA